jgi:hypothetical protein
VPQTDGKAIAALVSAIVAWMFCPVVAAIVALILAGQSARDIEASGGRLSGAGLNTAARIVAWLNIGLAGLFAVVIFASAATTSGSGY